MTRSVTVDVRGVPVPQGSMRLYRLPDGSTKARYPAAVWAWRAQVQQAVADLDEEPFRGAVELTLAFDLRRPAGHLGTGRNAGTVKASAPEWPVVYPDLDKLARLVDDAITDAGLWGDDAQVVSMRCSKSYVVTGPGVLIRIVEMVPRRQPAPEMPVLWDLPGPTVTVEPDGVYL